MARTRLHQRPITARSPARGAPRADPAEPTPSGEQEIETTRSTNFRKPQESQRRNAIEAMRLRAEGLDHTKIAAKLGYKNAKCISDLLYHAGEKGWFIASDAEEHLTYITAHKIVKNIDKGLDNPEGLSAGQLEMTIAAAKGRGFFKHYESTKTEGAPASLILGVKIEIADPTVKAKLLPAEGTIGGVPNYIDGDVEDAPSA